MLLLLLLLLVFLVLPFHLIKHVILFDFFTDRSCFGFFIIIIMVYTVSRCYVVCLRRCRFWHVCSKLKWIRHQPQWGHASSMRQQHRVERLLWEKGIGHVIITGHQLHLYRLAQRTEHLIKLSHQLRRSDRHTCQWWWRSWRRLKFVFV